MGFIDTYTYTDQLYDELQSEHMVEQRHIKLRGVLKWGLVILMAIVGIGLCQLI